MIDPTLKTLGILASIVAGVFAIRKILGWLFPVRVAVSVFMQRRELGPDEIRATVTNRSREPLYIIKCRGRNANTIEYILKTHLKNPFTKPSRYPCIWYGVTTYDLMGANPIKIEPDQPIKLVHKLNFKLPIFAFTSPMLLVEVTLSNGRKFRSRRIIIPERWHMKNHIHRNDTEKENA